MVTMISRVGHWCCAYCLHHHIINQCDSQNILCHSVFVLFQCKQTVCIESDQWCMNCVDWRQGYWKFSCSDCILWCGIMCHCLYIACKNLYSCLYLCSKCIRNNFEIHIFVFCRAFMYRSKQHLFNYGVLYILFPVWKGKFKKCTSTWCTWHL